MIWTREQAKALTDRALSFSKAEETTVILNGGDRANVRFARNTATTSGATSGYSLAITASFGKKSGTVTTAEFDDASLQRAMRNAEEIARLSPENPEAMPSLGAADLRAGQGVLRRRGERDAGVARVVRADRDRVEQEEGRRVGRLRRDLRPQIQAVANSKGLFALRPVHRGRLQPHGAHAGRHRVGLGVEARSTSCGSSIPRRSPRPRSTRPRMSKSPVAIEPGKYTVVLEPAAVADLLAFMVFSADARQADEGRSFFSKKGGGNRIGEQIVGEKVRIYSDPAHPLAPAVRVRRRGPAARSTSSGSTTAC